MSWPTAEEVEARTKVTLAEGVTSYGLSVTDLLASAQAYAEAYCGREFDEATVTEVHDGGTVVVVRRPPIVTVRKLLVSGTELSADAYYIYPHFVRINYARITGLYRREPVPDYPQAVAITYDGGYSDADGPGHIPIPAELKEIVLEIACRWLLKIDEQYRLDRNAANVSIGNVSARFEGKDEALADLYRRLDRYRMVVT